jgi:hypothetical protein
MINIEIRHVQLQLFEVWTMLIKVFFLKYSEWLGMLSQPRMLSIAEFFEDFIMHGFTVMCFLAGKLVPTHLSCVRVKGVFSSPSHYSLCGFFLGLSVVTDNLFIKCLAYYGFTSFWPFTLKEGKTRTLWI